MSLFRCLPDSAMVTANLTESIWHLGNMVDPSNQSSQNTAPDLTLSPALRHPTPLPQLHICGRPPPPPRTRAKVSANAFGSQFFALVLDVLRATKKTNLGKVKFEAKNYGSADQIPEVYLVHFEPLWRGDLTANGPLFSHHLRSCVANRLLILHGKCVNCL